jgi:predicted Zn-dependent protease
MEQSDWKRRLFSALAIALVGFVIYMSQIEENPVTGERQHVAISPSQEIKLGLESAPAMAKEMGGEVSPTDPRGKEVQAIGEYIVNNSIAKKGPWNFQFHLLADPNTVNAFALPGGQIFITVGLYKQLQNQAQLAGVLSHEIGHVLERHSAEQMAKSQLGQTLVVAAGATTENQNNSMMIANVVNQMIQMSYSRGDESEADTWGLKLMEEVGFTPYAMIDVMKILKASDGGGGETLEMFKTHPNPDLRIEQIQAYLAEHPPREGLSEGKPLPQVSGGNVRGSLFDFR